MSFAKTYFNRFPCNDTILEDNPNNDLGIIIVIPCYDDKFVFETLNSIEKADKPKSGLEIIVVINSGILSPSEVVAENLRIFNELCLLKDKKHFANFKLFPLLFQDIPKKFAGVGNARKIGMDEALRRFEFLSKPRGLIVSLDADTLVAKNYLTEIESAFILNQSESGFTLQFKHDFNKEIYSTEVINACKLYETYLRYFRLSIEITGYPNSFHTIGSCFAVDAISYAKVGGMSRRQGGEDFYFLHKLAQMGEIGQINKPLVFPSPRISDRVPFGTGPAVRNIIADKNYMVYNFYLFFILKEFFDCFENFWNFESLHTIEIPEEILLFVGKDKLFETIMECKNNCNQISSFKKRLFSKFDAFFIVKFLNSFNKSQKYPPLPVTEAVTLLLEKSGITTNSHSIDEVYDKIFDLDVECVSSA